MSIISKIIGRFALLVIIPSGYALASVPKEYHVSTTGNDSNPGSLSSPFKTISAAAKVARAGETITVHKGVYRERINPPLGGISSEKRITYQAAKGETVIIKGSELAKNWSKVKADCWKTTVPNETFGDFNPFNDTIRGDWFICKGRTHHTGAVYLNGHWLTEATNLAEVMKPLGKTALWFATVNQKETTIFAQFKGVNPNKELVEINARQSVFYPKKPGINFITVRGFTLEHAATNWAPPTAEQIGIIGTHWSKGWIIEDNIIRYSTCTGVTLGKYGDQWDNTSANAAVGYVKTIERATEEAGWCKENIGHHIVRNNHISHCEQAGIVGSLGAIFSQITGNTIHDIHIRRLFTGHEMGGIKIHAPIDCLISKNHIYRTNRGIWLDWMTQGTRVTRNLMHDNGPREDLFIEVNHGPYVVDNNILLSKNTLLDNSQGGCYAHNLIAGQISFHPQGRKTPYHIAHSTKVAGLAVTKCGDNRFYNNIFIGGSGISSYNNDKILPSVIAGNIYLNGVKPYSKEKNSVVLKVNSDFRLITKADGLYLKLNLPSGPKSSTLVTTKRLGLAKIPNLPYLNFNGAPLVIDRDFFGVKRNSKKPSSGPFAYSPKKKLEWKLTPIK